MQISDVMGHSTQSSGKCMICFPMMCRIKHPVHPGATNSGNSSLLPAWTTRWLRSAPVVPLEVKFVDFGLSTGCYQKSLHSQLYNIQEGLSILISSLSSITFKGDSTQSFIQQTIKSQSLTS